MLTYKKNETANQINLVLTEEVGIEQAAKMQEHLMEAFKDTAELVINLEQVSDLHITAIQLITSAFTEAKKIAKNVSLQGHLSEPVKRILENSGMIYKDGIVLENEKNSFWVRGGN